MIHNNDALIALRDMPDNSVDSVVTDPPYGISFMNKHWDYDVPKVEVWKEVFRVLKPGGHILCACGTRTQHRMTVNIEDAGFEIKDVIAWIYGSGFPKSLNLGDGQGTALKPAMELWTLGKKPISEKNISDNVKRWGTGGINIDECRIDFLDDKDFNSATFGRGTDILGGNYVGASHSTGRTNIEANPLGRFPANVILDEEAGAMLDLQAPKTGAFAPVKSGHNGDSKGIYGDFDHKGDDGKTFHDGQLAGASRFFYCPKASPSERNKGLEGFDLKAPAYGSNLSSSNKGTISNSKKPKQNFHPTVKPVSLMKYLCKMITPKGGTVLDPYMGSGTTGIGALTEGFLFIGIENEKEYCEIAQARINAYVPGYTIEASNRKGIDIEEKPKAYQQTLF